MFEGKKYSNMKEVMDILKISKEGFRILRIVRAIVRIDYNEELKEVGQNGGETDNTRI